MALAAQVIEGDRRALARAITLVESTRDDHRAEAGALLDELLPRTGGALRLGISGAPGAGKSTFIESLGLRLVGQGHRVAVLAVDPTSTRSGGSILGDKTRMDELARRPGAYIRPSPSGGALGGVAHRTRESILVCEASGFDIVIVETVGVGQSETDVDDMVDVFVLLVSPGAGDELQGMKRGVTELADLVVVTKADGDLLAPARQAAADYRHALHLLRPKHAAAPASVLLCSSVNNDGIDEVWDAVVATKDRLEAGGELDARRSAQAKRWLWAEVRAQLMSEVEGDEQLRAVASEVEEEVAAGRLSTLGGARRLLALRGSARPGSTAD